MHATVIQNVASTKLNCAFNNCDPNSKKKRNKKYEFKKIYGLLSARGISAILIINAPKGQQSAGNGNFSSNAMFSSTEVPLD